MHRLDNAQHELSDTKEQLAATSKQITNLTFLINAHLTTMNPTHMSANITSIHLDSMATAFGNQECPVTIKMLEYINKKKDNIDWYSGSFYTHNNGYKMCLNVCVGGDGNGEGTHLSVYLYLTKGPHDDNLKWLLKVKFIIKLLNQVSDNLHYQKSLR